MGDMIIKRPMRRAPASLHDYVVENLRHMIVDGRLEQGAAINEPEIATQLQVSRGPVREALKVLRAEGLIDIRPRRGARVVKLSERDIRNLYDVLTSLEILAVRSACLNASDIDIAVLADLNSAMGVQYQLQNARRYFELNQRIHEYIVEISGNPVLSQIYAGIAARARMVRLGTSMPLVRWSCAMAEHEAILAAVIVRDVELAGLSIEKHLRQTVEIVAKQAAASFSSESGELPKTHR